MRGSLLFLLLTSSVGVAAPRDFPFTWTSQTQDSGKSQFELWFTPRIARSDDFVLFEGRLGWTYGVAKNLETMLAVDADLTRTDLTQGMEGKVSNIWRWTTWRSAGAPFSAGGVGRISLGLDRLELEGRLLADLKIDRVLFALNVSGERTLFWNGRTGVNNRLEESLGVRFALSKTATFGVEARVKSSWEDRLYRGTAVYVGPTLSWTHELFWISVGGYAQVAAERGDGDRGDAEVQELRDNERFVLRLTVGANTK